MSRRSLSMNYLEPGQKPTAFISSEKSHSQELVKVKYTRVEAESPEFATIYESVNQSVDVEFSTIVLCAQPEPVVAMYDFMMSTFVNNNKKPAPVPASAAIPAGGHAAIALPAEPTPSPSQSSVEQIRVNVKLQGVEGKSLVFPFADRRCSHSDTHEPRIQHRKLGFIEGRCVSSPSRQHPQDCRSFRRHFHH
jgi:vacuolar protein sorting-associated protein 13A/C